MYCPGCGTAVDPGHSYCSECGSELPDADPAGAGGDGRGPGPGQSAGEDRPGGRETGSEYRFWQNGYFDVGDLALTLNPSRRGTIYVTDEALVCGFESEYTGGGLPGYIGLLRWFLGGPGRRVSLEAALGKDRTVRVPYAEMTNVRIVRRGPVGGAREVVVERAADSEVRICPGTHVDDAGTRQYALDLVAEIDEAAAEQGYSIDLG